MEREIDIKKEVVGNSVIMTFHDGELYHKIVKRCAGISHKSGTFYVTDSGLWVRIHDWKTRTLQDARCIWAIKTGTGWEVDEININRVSYLMSRYECHDI